jgi:hypothetical protein
MSKRCRMLVHSFAISDEENDKCAKTAALSASLTMMRRDWPACNIRHLVTSPCPPHTRWLLASGVIETGDDSIGDHMSVTHGTM